MKKLALVLGAVVLIAVAGLAWFASGWYGSADVEEDTTFIVPQGATLTAVAWQLHLRLLKNLAKSQFLCHRFGVYDDIVLIYIQCT